MNHMSGDKSAVQLDKVVYNNFSIGFRISSGLSKFDCLFSDFLLFFGRQSQSDPKTHKKPDWQNSITPLFPKFTKEPEEGMLLDVPAIPPPPKEIKPHIVAYDQHSLAGDVFISPAEKGDAPVWRAPTHGGHISAQQIFSAMIDHLMDGVSSGQDSASVRDVAKRMETNSMLRPFHLNRTGRLFAELIACSMEGEITGPREFRQKGLDILKKIALEGGFTEADQRLIKLMDDNSTLFLDHGLGAMMVWCGHKLPQDYLDPAAKAAYGFKPEEKLPSPALFMGVEVRNRMTHEQSRPSR